MDKSIFEDKNYKATLKRCSKDDANNTYMTESEFECIYFDKVKEKFCYEKLEESEKDFIKSVFRSNDALIKFENDNYLFIEFKNGDLHERDREQIHSKLSDSLLIFHTTLKEDLDFIKEHVNYILVVTDKQAGDINQAIKSKTGFWLGQQARCKIFFHKSKQHDFFISKTQFEEIASALENSNYIF